MKTLIPRLSADQSVERFQEIQDQLRSGTSAGELPRVDLGGAVPNATGGRAPTPNDVASWRAGVCGHVASLAPSGPHHEAIFSRDLGRALESVIHPSHSDAAHDGVWSYLSLMVFPDLVARRWGLSSGGTLSVDRWIGAQVGRDRNYLKTCWRNWLVLGNVMEEADHPLGEDEFVALLERTALARNPVLIRLAAHEIVRLEPGGGVARTAFARELMKRLTFHTGPIVLDLLSEEELQGLVSSQAIQTLSVLAAAPRRSMSH